MHNCFTCLPRSNQNISQPHPSFSKHVLVTSATNESPTSSLTLDCLFLLIILNPSLSNEFSIFVIPLLPYLPHEVTPQEIYDLQKRITDGFNSVSNSCIIDGIKRRKFG